METLKRFFASIKWWEYCFMTIFCASLICAGVLCKSGALVIVNAIISILTVFFLAKGKLIGNVFGVSNSVLYCIISFQNKFYREIICTLAFTFPTYALSILTWIRNLNKTSGTVKVNKNLSWKEWVILLACGAAIAVGVYWMLWAFHTANLIFSTLSVTIGALAGWLLIRRCEYNFAFFILANIVCIVLWFSTINKGDISQVPTIMAFCMFLFLNSFGIVNWVKAKLNARENI